MTAGTKKAMKVHHDELLKPAKVPCGTTLHDFQHGPWILLIPYDLQIRFDCLMHYGALVYSLPSRGSALEMYLFQPELHQSSVVFG